MFFQRSKSIECFGRSKKNQHQPALVHFRNDRSASFYVYHLSDL